MDLHWIDISIFIVYFIALLAIGFYFYRTNKSDEDYYVGGRGLSAGHIGLSVVATDVGGGFSIGLGGLGFSIGIAGSWMLFTGLLGAWLSAVYLIPKIYPIARKKKLLSFPQAVEHYYTRDVALAAGIISLIGYVGFSSSQILAGAKLASATFPTAITLEQAVWAMGVVAVLYTVFGGIKAVIYTDTVQWIILLTGLVGIGLPMGYYFVGGMEGIREFLPAEMLSFGNITVSQVINWLITIVPIWFVGMTLYQRIYAAKDEKTAIRAWRIAGVFEYPFMAFMGVLLGMFAKVAYLQGAFADAGFTVATAATNPLDAEMGLPLLLRTMLPVGLMGLMLSAYFSAIMSTADSCLMAASGNLMTDIIGRFKKKMASNLVLSQILTFVIGAFAIVLALHMQNVLELMLYSYAFMVSGLFVPVLAMLFIKNPSPAAALVAMIGGGTTTLILILMQKLEGLKLPYELDANLFGISVSILLFAIVHSLVSKKAHSEQG
ncbi:sodium:solute symporter [Bernardetia sp. OM2101]|uniref:sodium:solute symporter family protein n=1 Tax=Bernardetia sp. OM2101 TaxID=3344876 RepID=UPI0035D0B40B